MDLRRIPDIAAVPARRGPLLTGFEQFFFASAEIGHPVYYAGERANPPLVLLQEIAGFSPGLVHLAARLLEARYQIYIPWMFGPFGRRAPVRNALRLCVSREFANLRAGVDAPIASWLRALVGHVSAHNDERLVGALGMCLTGGFAIPLVVDPSVKAAVAAQPSVPFSLRHVLFGLKGSGRLSALNVDPDTIAAARQRLGQGEARLLALRCRADRLCPAEKLSRLQQEFPVGFEVREYGDPGARNRLGERPHATFTKEYRLEPDAPPDHHSRQAFSDLTAFFDAQLRAGGRS
jgi:dienelactone hydrolase